MQFNHFIQSTFIEMFAGLFFLMQKNSNRYEKNMTPSLNYFFYPDETDKIWNRYLLPNVVNF